MSSSLVIQQSAPAKLILCGEHAVVYGQPALALPLTDLRAEVTVRATAQGTGLHVIAPDLDEAWLVREQPAHPLSALLLSTLAQLVRPEPDLSLRLRSRIPIASGMGSGAAVATALVRALAAAHAVHLPPATIASLVYASEQRFHGTPSGIDNTVIAYEQAIWFVRAQQPATAPTLEPLHIAVPLQLVIGDTGIRSATRLPVAAVRSGWQADPPRYEARFAAIGELVRQARQALAHGDQPGLGTLLTTNHGLLVELGVSSPELDRLVAAALAAGALGAKLAGAGWGGIMFALVDPAATEAVATALHQAGAAQVLITSVA
ncbi:MAG: mevalonate kinase [Oscillochloridaceae bacterium umkhey_bin13]